MLCGREANDKFSLIFNNKSSEIDSAPTVIDTLTRSPANPSMVRTMCAHIYIVVKQVLHFRPYYCQQTTSISMYLVILGIHGASIVDLVTSLKITVTCC